tara:strand:+ start:38063 stop:38839 length:777 start_codon:yes stop_codon:yes gene_type:complete
MNPEAPVKRKRRTWTMILLMQGCLSIGSGCASLAALDRQAGGHLPHGVVESAHPVPMTLPRFLGLDVVCRRTVLLGQVTREKAATFVPALEPKPLALPVSHPANADSPSPAVAAAHKTKKAKVAKAAKVKAVAVLAGEDCSTNPHVEEGILAALDDVEAEVRIAAIEAVIRSQKGCDIGCGGCCSDLIRKKLSKIALEKTGPCCWFEPNSKARRLARLAVDGCGGPLPYDDCQCGGIDELIPIESPPIEIIEEIWSTP